MADITEEKARLRRQMSEQAIALAMKGQWKEAISVNQSILEVVPTDVDAYNRLGKAHMELGELAQAREAYTKALELDHNNAIARRNLERVSQLEDLRVAIKNDRSKVSPDFFIGELGKTGVLNLQKLSPSTVLAKMTAMDRVYLKVQGHKVVVENEQRECLGILEPQHGNRLAKLIEGGNKYTAAIYKLDNNKAKVFVRESFQHPNLEGKLSFSTKVVEDFQAHIKDTLLRHGETDEELLEEGEIEDIDLEEGELLPAGFSIFEAGVYMDEMADDELPDEE
jgi:tetratricopeptide (TPR) repeat protein